MPFVKDPGKRESECYCSLCYKDEKFTYEGNDFREFQALAYEGMLERGVSPVRANLYVFAMRFAPRWKQ